ncbi:shikimate kinase [Heyndrickxia acidicola]|uniref:Shikimate kinase n=1 Tax=Heyndrickxia acidicola TaxID=209389 RepID=A0ABU6MKD5_9BACI|nr:shikimate kinase [Heyndrickxia acidicola]MED1205148.1 shikimate kinase [Heyndrickxia acidicola]
MAPIYLIGFMGAGKTTVGKALSQSLGYPAADLDELIEKDENQKISAMFSLFGEEYFRNKETEKLIETREFNGILATGGGIILKEENRKWLKENGLTVFLKCPPEVAIDRIMGDPDRPNAVNRSFTELKELYLAREPFYENCAHIIIDTSLDSVEDTVGKIMDRLNK